MTVEDDKKASVFFFFFFFFFFLSFLKGLRGSFPCRGEYRMSKWNPCLYTGDPREGCAIALTE